MRAALARKTTITEGGTERRLSLLEVMLRTIANKAAKGDLKAASFVFNLLNTPEAAEGDDMDLATLSGDDQALFRQIMEELAGPGANAALPESDEGEDREGTSDEFVEPASENARDGEREQS